MTSNNRKGGIPRHTLYDDREYRIQTEQVVVPPSEVRQCTVCAVDGSRRRHHRILRLGVLLRPVNRSDYCFI